MSNDNSSETMHSKVVYFYSQAQAFKVFSCPIKKKNWKQPLFFKSSEKENFTLPKEENSYDQNSQHM